MEAAGLPPREQPVIPVGWDAYRQWDRWPYLRIGARTYMRSTYDRSGGNESADASHFLYQLAEGRNVTLDVEGAGILYFVRYNHWHGSPWHWEVDGTDHLIQETSTRDPKHPVPGSTFIPETVFPAPVAWTWSDTKGADLSWVPVPFRRSFRMAYSRTHYGTGYYIYQQYLPGTPLSRPIRTWTPGPPPRDVVKLLQSAGTDIAPKPEPDHASVVVGAALCGRPSVVHEHTGTCSLQPGVVTRLTELSDGPRMIRALQLSIPRQSAVAFQRARLRIRWDGRADDSVDAPACLLFGAGTLYNRDGREFLVKALPVNIRFDAERIHLACYFPMPFFHSAAISLVGDGGVEDVRWSLRDEPLAAQPGEVGYFHATYRDHPHPELGRDLTLLDTNGIEGEAAWSGHLVGTSFIFSHNANLSTLEGDPRFFFDDSLTPQAQGTGTEEWAGGGDYWGGRNMTLPLAGHPVGAPSPREARNEEDKIESGYRFLLADLMPFGFRARICLEHGGTDESTEHYETVTYWYGWPKPSLVETDSLQIGDDESERGHAYHSPSACPPYEIVSRYEWGVDTLHGREIYPAERDRARTMTGTSEFTLKIDPRNVGVMLRRKLDYHLANQRAEVYVSNAEGAARWRLAGIWYLAGSNTCVYSNPPDELGAAQHVVQTSNRRFRDDEFLLARRLTQGRSAIRLRIRFTPVSRPLFPGGPVPPNAWSEIRYTAYSFLLPL